MTRIIVILERGFGPAPESLLKETFGPETIVDIRGDIKAVGTSIMLEGEPEQIREWILSVGGSVWTSENPMMGHWAKRSISKE